MKVIVLLVLLPGIVIASFCLMIKTYRQTFELYTQLGAGPFAADFCAAMTSMSVAAMIVGLIAFEYSRNPKS